MKTSIERETEFRKDLAELLANHRAQMTLDTYKHAAMVSAIANICMLSEWDENGNQTAEYTEFNIYPFDSTLNT